MNCPYCASSTKVTNSRSTAKQTKVWRRRECKKCHNIWTTHEGIDLSTSHVVTSSDSPPEPFSRDKLFISIKDSLAHRKTALADATALTDTVLARVLTQKTTQIDSTVLITITYDVLRRYDKTAAAVYRASR